MTAAPSSRSDRRRTAILDAAAQLLRDRGPAGLTTRAVAEAAGVQAPAIYRLFGDKDGLLDAVAEYVMATYVSAKAAIVTAASSAGVDPLEDLRSGWDAQIDFGLANPALFRLLSDPDRVTQSPAAQAGRRVLESRVHRIAETGRLGVNEQLAVNTIQAAGIGVIQTMLSLPAAHRDLALARTMWDAVLRHILIDAPEPADASAVAAAVAFRATASGLEVLSAAERRLLDEWLDRVISAH